MKKAKKSLFPNNFFNTLKQEKNSNSKASDDVPFKWSKSVLDGTSKVKIVKCENPKV